MNLTLSRRGDYAVRAALHLTHTWDQDGYEKVREIAAEMDLPRSYTPQVLGLLVRAGLAEAKAGRDGGYRLSRAPEEISLLEIVEAAEDQLVPTVCTLRGGPCRWESVCAVHPAWVAASEALRRALGSVSLDEVAEVDLRLEGDGRPAPGARGRGARP